MQASDGIQFELISARENNLKMDWNYFGRDLAALRRKHGWLQKQVALTSGFAPSYLAALEGGRRPPPPSEALGKILDAIDATEVERTQLSRAAALTHITRAISNHLESFPGAAAAVSLLEVSPEMSSTELGAIQALVEGYRFRQLLPRRANT
jgi:transcriptional regulator with XRE-family HTH domain